MKFTSKLLLLLALSSLTPAYADEIKTPGPAPMAPTMPTTMTGIATDIPAVLADPLQQLQRALESRGTNLRELYAARMSNPDGKRARLLDWKGNDLSFEALAAVLSKFDSIKNRTRAGTAQLAAGKFSRTDTVESMDVLFTLSSTLSLRFRETWAVNGPNKPRTLLQTVFLNEPPASRPTLPTPPTGMGAPQGGGTVLPPDNLPVIRKFHISTIGEHWAVRGSLECAITRGDSGYQVQLRNLYLRSERGMVNIKGFRVKLGEYYAPGKWKTLGTIGGLELNRSLGMKQEINLPLDEQFNLSYAQAQEQRWLVGEIVLVDDNPSGEAYVYMHSRKDVFGRFWFQP